MKQWSVYTTLQLLEVLCYPFNKPTKVPWQLGVITTAKAGSDGRNPMKHRIEFHLFLSVCHLWCCAQRGLFHLQTKEEFVCSKAVAVLLGWLCDCWNNLQPFAYKSFWTFINVFWEGCALGQVGAKQQKAGGERGCWFGFIFSWFIFIFFLFSLAQSHTCCSSSVFWKPCKLPREQHVPHSHSPLISSWLRISINEDYNNLKVTLLLNHFCGTSHASCSQS